MATRLARLLGIQAGEGTRVVWLVALSLCNGVFSALFLTAANAEFLARFPIDVLPIAYLVASAVGYIGVRLFAQGERHVSFPALLLLTIGALLATGTAGWLAWRATNADLVVFFMFVLVGPMFTLIALGYWGLAGRLFDLRQGKRLFGLVGAGEDVSTIAGLFATPLVVQLVGGTGQLIPLALLGLACAFVAAVVITRRFGASLVAEAAPSNDTTGTAGPSALLRERYFGLMAAAVALMTLALYAIDFSFLAQVRQRFESPAQIAQFLGVFYGVVKIVEFLLKVTVSGPLISAFGLGAGMLVLPVTLLVPVGLGVLVGAIGLSSATFFVLVVLTKLLAVAGRTSTFEPAFRVLYQPLAPSTRLSYQSHVEGTARQLAVGVVGIALLLVSRAGSYDALTLFVVLVPILGLWGCSAWFAYREYRARLFDGLRGRIARITPTRLTDVARRYLETYRDTDRGAAEQMLEQIQAPAVTAVPLEPERRMMLVRQLASPRQATEAAAALTALGDAVVPDLARALSQPEHPWPARRRIVNILGAIGGPAAGSLLATQLESPDRLIRRRAIAHLVASAWRAPAEQVPLIERTVETLVRDLAWDLNVGLALVDAPGCEDVRAALDGEARDVRGWIFDLLGFLHDPAALAGIREVLTSGTPQATVYALEMLDLLVSPVLKPYVFPVVEGQTPHQIVSRLEAVVVRDPLTWQEALRALVRRDYGRIGMWTRALALDQLARTETDVPPDVVAFLFHADPLLREVAALRIAERDQAAWATHRARLSFDVREALDAIVRAGHADADAEAHSVFGRARLLAHVAGFADLVPEHRLAVAAAAELRPLHPGQHIPSPRDPAHAFYLSLSGLLELRRGDTTVVLPPLTLCACPPGATALEVTQEARLLRLDPAVVFECAADAPDLLPSLFRALTPGHEALPA